MICLANHTRLNRLSSENSKVIIQFGVINKCTIDLCRLENHINNSTLNNFIVTRILYVISQ